MFRKIGKKSAKKDKLSAERDNQQNSLLEQVRNSIPKPKPTEPQPPLSLGAYYSRSPYRVERDLSDLSSFRPSYSERQVRNTKMSTPKPTVTQSPYNHIRYRVDRDLSDLSSERHTMHHSFTNPNPTKNPFHIQNEAGASDLLPGWSNLNIRPTPVGRNVSEEFKESRMEIQQRSTPTATSSQNSSVSPKQEFIMRCQLRTSEPMNIYVPVINPSYEDQTNMIRKFDIGESNMYATEKVIMMVGATGSGKTTLINGLINYIFGVKWEDDFRLKLIEEKILNQAESITKFISSYTIHHQQGFNVPYTITIIDTPGFGDTKGIKRDQEITKQIKTFFSTAGPSGVDRLDAVAFVAQSSLARLTPSQKYIFESILALFGKDIENCIMLLLTFADGQKPQILDSIKEVNLPHRKHWKFNNSALFSSNKGSNDPNSDDDSDDEKDDDTVVDKSFWERGEKSFKSLITDLSKVQPTSLIQTKEVLGERMKLETSIEGIQREIKQILGKLERLATEVNVLRGHEDDLDRNRNFNYKVTETNWIQKKTDPGQYTTNCLKCFVTCHESCMYKNDADKIKCWAMTNKYCRICPGKCFWDMHSNQPFVYVCEHEQQTKTLQGLRTKYEEVEGKKLIAEQVVKKCANEFEAAQVELLSLAEAARKSIQRLEEIALRPNPLSTVDYIDLLIKGEEMEGKPFWQERVTQLKEVRNIAVHMQQVMERNLDPFAEYKKKVEEERRENIKGVWSRAAEYLKRGFDVKF